MSKQGQSQAEATLLAQMGSKGSPVGRYFNTVEEAASGSTAATAQVLNVSSMSLVRVVSSGGVKMPRADADGFVIAVHNSRSGGPLVVYADEGNQINETLSLSIGPLLTVLFIWKESMGKWYSIPTVPS